jgi:hypothetical protein
MVKISSFWHYKLSFFPKRTKACESSSIMSLLKSNYKTKCIIIIPPPLLSYILKYLIHVINCNYIYHKSRTMALAGVTDILNGQTKNVSQNPLQLFTTVNDTVMNLLKELLCNGSVNTFQHMHHAIIWWKCFLCGLCYIAASGPRDWLGSDHMTCFL